MYDFHAHGGFIVFYKNLGARSHGPVEKEMPLKSRGYVRGVLRALIRYCRYSRTRNTVSSAHR